MSLQGFRSKYQFHKVLSYLYGSPGGTFLLISYQLILTTYYLSLITYYLLLITYNIIYHPYNGEKPIVHSL